MPARFRRAGPGDAALIQLLLQEQADHHGETLARGVEALERHGFGARPLFRALLAEDDATGEALGFALYYPDFSTLRGAAGVMLQDIYFRPAARGMGLGRLMLARIMQDAADWEAEFMTLMLDRENSAARAFYGKAGFALRGDYDLLILEGPALDALKEAL